jgi:hypothetical protein
MKSAFRLLFDHIVVVQNNDDVIKKSAQSIFFITQEAVQLSGTGRYVIVLQSSAVF